MSEHLYSTLSFTADTILDLFAKYFTLAEEAREKGDIETFKYWSNRTMDLSKEYHRIKNDMVKLEENGECEMRSKKWYQKKLGEYFDKFFMDWADIAEFFPDPAPNQWLFTIPQLEIKIRLTCDDEGKIRDERIKIN